jgi:hypothetical protein
MLLKLSKSITAIVLLLSTAVAQAGLIFDVTEYTENTMKFQVSGTLDQAYDSNRYDSVLFVATDFNLREFWNTSSVSFSGTTFVNDIASNWARWDNGNDTGYAFYSGIGEGFDVLLSAGSTFNIAITATGSFNVVDYSASDFELYMGIASGRVAQHLLASQTDIPEPTTLTILALGMIGLVSRRFKKQS